MTRVLSILLAVLLTGCATPEPIAEGPELPPIQAAAANLATADDLAAAGYEADAIRQYEQARQRDPSVRVAHRLAVLYDRLARDDRALAEYRRAMTESPDDPGLHNDLGYFYLSRDRPAQAEPLFRRALALDASMQRAWVNLGLCLAAQGRTAEAVEAMDRVLPPEQSRSNAAMVLAREQRFDEARALAVESLSIRPDLAQPRALLDWLDARADAPADDAADGA